MQKNTTFAVVLKPSRKYIYRMKRILYITLLALLAVSCAKDASGRYGDAVEFPEANLVITGNVFDRLSSAPLPSIRVTLKSYLPSDKLRENPIATESTTSGDKGQYSLRKRYNESVDAMVHTVEFMDESFQYLPFTNEITIANWSLLLTPHGYEITHFNAFLDQTE